MSSRSRRALQVLSVLVLAITAGTVVSQVRPAPTRPIVRQPTTSPTPPQPSPPEEPASPPAQSGFVRCEYTWAEYMNGGLAVTCSPVGGGSALNFTVLRTDSPNIEEVLSVIQPVILTQRLVAVIPSNGGTTPVSNFQWRVGIGYEGGKITRLRVASAN